MIDSEFDETKGFIAGNRYRECSQMFSDKMFSTILVRNMELMERLRITMENNSIYLMKRKQHIMPTKGTNRGKEASRWNANNNNNHRIQTTLAVVEISNGTKTCFTWWASDLADLRAWFDFQWNGSIYVFIYSKNQRLCIYIMRNMNNVRLCGLSTHIHIQSGAAATNTHNTFDKCTLLCRCCLFDRKILANGRNKVS